MDRQKKNPMIIISDDEDENEFTVKSNLRYSKSKREATKSAPRANPKRPKRDPLFNSCPRLNDDTHASGFDQIKLICEEFDEGIRGFKAHAGTGSIKDLWVDKYKPQYLDDLAVQKKKVEEVKTWFEERLTDSKDASRNNVLLLVGPSGAGKSATVDAVASHLGANVFEWNTPIPTIWHEHLHNSESGLRYMSKMEEFENFVERMRKYGPMMSFSSKTTHTSLVLVIDDLPAVNGRVIYGRLLKCLHLLVHSVCTPTVILISEYSRSDSAEYHSHYWEELQSSLLSAGADKVAFNAITVNSIKKTLLKIAKKELFQVSTEQVDLIAKASGGDIRHAITSLQYFCLKPHHQSLLSSSKRMHTSSRETPYDISPCSDNQVLRFGRDETLSLFHALGKFLHNKRESERTIIPGANEFQLKEKYFRLPLKMDVPEMILWQSHGQARAIADFLHENVLDFVDEEAINDAWSVASYLSDSDFLLASLNRITRSFEAENVLQSVAASVAVRGVLYGNSHPAPSRWHAIRRPKLWQIEQSLWKNKYQLMVSQRFNVHHGLTLSDPSVFCTEVKPVLEWLGGKAYEDSESRHISADDMLEDENFVPEGETSADEIEDW